MTLINEVNSVIEVSSFGPKNIRDTIQHIKTLTIEDRKGWARAYYALFALCLLVTRPGWRLLLALLAFWRLVAEPVFSKPDAR